MGSISLARYKVFTTSDEIFDDLKLLLLNPLVAMFLTTRRFTSDALELAQKSGVIARSGEQLTVFLADRGIGISNDKGTMKFDKGQFHKW